MDELLARRYKALFVGYGVGGSNLLISRVKSRIVSQESRYREDAMYFLLVNLDHMVIRPLAGYIPEEDRSLWGRPMPRRFEPDEMGVKLDECFAIIEGKLETPHGERADAHAVIRAIDASQRELDGALWYPRTPVSV